jgi:hypothetical protein
MNRTIILSCLSLILFFALFSCDNGLDEEFGGSGVIDGKAVFLPDNMIGIDGIARPWDKLFPKNEKVKYTLWPSHSSLLHDEYNIQEGDSLYFFFEYHAIGEADYKTVISIMTDLTINGVLM